MGELELSQAWAELSKRTIASNHMYLVLLLHQVLHYDK
jgi:hypothetical protein